MRRSSRGTCSAAARASTANLFYNAMRDAQRELDFDLNSPGGTGRPVADHQRAEGAQLRRRARADRESPSRLTLRAGRRLAQHPDHQDDRAQRPVARARSSPAHRTSPAAAGADWAPAAESCTSPRRCATTAAFGATIARPAVLRVDRLDDRRRPRELGQRAASPSSPMRRTCSTTFHMIGWAGSARRSGRRSRARPTRASSASASRRASSRRPGNRARRRARANSRPGPFPRTAGEIAGRRA